METDFYAILKKYDIDLHTFTKEMLLEIDNIEKYLHICDIDVQKISNLLTISGISKVYIFPNNNDIHNYVKNFRLFLQKKDEILSRKVFWSDDLNTVVGNQNVLYQKILTDLMSLFRENEPILDQIQYIHKHINLCLQHSDSEYYPLIIATDKKLNDMYPIIDNICKNAYKLAEIENNLQK